MIPPSDKPVEIYDSIKEKNYFKAGILALLLFNGYKKDLDELDDTIKQVKDIFKTGKFKREDYQVPHSFVEGTKIEKSKYAKYLAKFDVTLFDLPMMQSFLELLGMKNIKELPQKKKNYKEKPINKLKVIGNPIAEVLGRSFMRIPLLGVGIFGLVEIPTIYKAKDHNKQAEKSCINISLTIFCSALLGAIGAYYPPFGFIGAGIGALAGNKLAEKINKKAR